MIPQNTMNSSPEAHTAPVNCLYPELLCCIMQMYLDAKRPPDHTDLWWEVPCEPAILLSHVCSHWRTIAIGNRALWSRIFVPVLPTPLDLSKIIDCLETYILRSDPMPLHIFLGEEAQVDDYLSLQDLRELGLEDANTAILSSLLAAKDRWQSFNAPALFFLYGPVSRFFYFPILERVTIRENEQCIEEGTKEFLDEDMILFMHSPKLRHIQDEQVGFQFPWAELEHVTLGSWDLFLLINKSCVNLKTLTLEGSLVRDIDDSSRRYVLPIEGLTIENPAILGCLTTPYLTSLSTTSSRAVDHLRDEMILDFLARSACSTSLKRLSYHLSRHNVHIFTRLLHAVPNLESLEITWDEMRDSHATEHRTDLWTRLIALLGQPNVLVPRLKSLALDCPQVLDATFITMLHSRLGNGLIKTEVKFQDSSRYRAYPELKQLVRERADTWLTIRDEITEISKGGVMELNIIGERGIRPHILPLATM